MPRRVIKRIREKGRELRKEVRARTMGYILAGLGLVAGLAWNEAIKAFIEQMIPVGGNTLFAKLLYAGVVTIIVVFASVYLARLLEDKEDGPGAE
ncbi:MAG: DUF5654 family protein [bacterium]|nr:DUF5654 family protein [bacterium]